MLNFYYLSKNSSGILQNMNKFSMVQNVQNIFFLLDLLKSTCNCYVEFFFFYFL